MWGPILGGFTILGVFLTFSAWINGRSIKRYIGELIKEESKSSRELIEKESMSSRELIERESTSSRELIERESTSSRELIERLITKLSDQHESMTKILTEMARSAK